MAPVIRPGDLGIVSRVTCDSQLIWYCATWVRFDPLILVVFILIY